MPDAHESRCTAIDAKDGLESFLPPVRAWFEEAFGRPTPPQAQGWPAIQRGEHTLILAPTGSGKTLAAFLWGIDQLFRELIAQQEAAREEPPSAEGERASKKEKRSKAANEQAPGVRLVYISPLKALNNDIHRNLRVPLAGIRHQADKLGLQFPAVRVAVRSGDTPQRERQAMLRQPPHILITTPESLYLLLTSPKARDMFRTVRTAIVDEIHTLAGNKRGVHLSLSLERLQHLASQPIQRLGLSATIQPLDEVAHFLGGNEWSARQADGTEPEAGERMRSLQPRPVTIVDAVYKKALDLRVVSTVESSVPDASVAGAPVADDASADEERPDVSSGSIWPAIIPRVLQLIRQHQTTLIFVNNRLLAERTADRLNQQIAAEAAGQTSGLVEGGVVKGIGLMATGSGLHGSPIRVHHGSVSKEARLELERQLKAGELPALVGTSSLELGIDIGSVDLIVQLQSCKSVAQGLQRVGRSGHLVGQTSKGRIFPTHREDLIEAAAIAGGMLRGEVEPTHTPDQPLDVLAQQIVAMVSVETWGTEALFDLVRCASAYERLTWRVFQTTLEMLAGRYPSQAYRELRARLSWDRVNNKLAALPGSRLLALTNGGTIPDTGAFGAYLSDGKTKLGELDEEFVFETRIGDTLLLGSQVWRVIDLTDDRIVVAEAPGAVPRVPFWRGDYPWRPYELGQQVGAFRRTVAERLEQIRQELHLQDIREIRRKRQTPAVQALLAWLQQDYTLDPPSAWQALSYIAGQVGQAGAISSDRTIVVEVFDDPIGDPRMVIHSPFGGRVNGPWGLALAGALRERTGTEIEVQTNDDGILFRLLDAEADFPLDVVTAMGPAEARERILRELPQSAVFGARFRQNAARALLLPGAGRGKRTPFWLQRLRAKDLLQVVRHFDDFPIVAETYRDCLQDVLDLPHLEQVLTGIQQGQIQVVVTESVTPSPVAQSLLWDMINIYMYEWDQPKAEQQLQMLAVNRDLLQDLLQDVALDELLRPEAIDAVRGQLQHTAPTALVRTVEELAVLLQQMGDLSSSEIALRAIVDPADWIARLAGENRIVELAIPTAHGPESRWVATELWPEYAAAFSEQAPTPGAINGSLHETASPIPPSDAQTCILRRFLAQAGPITLDAILARYAFPVDWLQAELDSLIAARQLIHGRFTPRTDHAGAPPLPVPTSTAEFVDRHTLEQIHRRTLHILRREVQPVPFAVYADFLARWQHMSPANRLTGDGALTKVLQQLRAFPVVGRVWERDVLPLRLAAYQPAELNALCQSGELVWIGSGGTDPRRGRIRFLFRGEGNVYLEPAPADLSALNDQARKVHGFLQSEGAAFFADICSALELEEQAVEAALIELVMAGLVTNDSLDTMRRIVEEGAPQPQERPALSSLEQELARRRERLGPNAMRSYPAGPLYATPRKSPPAQYRAAKRRVRQRLGLRADGGPPEPRWMGRWTLVHRFGVLGKAVPLAEQSGVLNRFAQQARQLLARYGIVTHECLANELGSWDWSQISQQLQRMEMRGEVRRGYFVQTLSGLQFALPDAVERLRAIRDEALSGAPLQGPEPVVMNACDPANLYGPGRDDGPQTVQGQPLSFSRVPSTWVVQHRGLPILVAGDSAADLTIAHGIDEAVIHRALQALVAHLSRFEHHVAIATWNGEPVLESAGRSLLEAAGFHRSYPAMVWERWP